MSLSPGSRVGVYEVVAPLGAGGMGEVYRARDSKLQRDVAIKVLIAAVAEDPDRLARFGREAQVLAALNHPNIAGIYGLEDNAIVMELVDGPTLADRLNAGAVPLDEAIAAARQICDALSAAHESGIVHRDLKPANIKIKADGTVKVLDFGLAKALEPTGASASIANSPTLSVHATQQGLILGTAAYMAPEQARGRAVDRRADIWAFGVVLYEMLSGRRAFEGDDVSITLASVLKDDVDWNALPQDLPRPVRRLLRRCLEKDPRRRLNSIADARLELDDADAEPIEVPQKNTPTAPPAPARLAWIVAAVMTVATLGVTAMWRPWRAEEPPAPVAFEIAAPEERTAFGTHLAISPDGRQLVTRAGQPGAVRLWVRSLDSTAGIAIAGTEGAAFPFWSPDGRHIAFFASDKLKRVDVRSGSISIVADSPEPRGGSWSADGTILFSAGGDSQLMRVSANGGSPTRVLELDVGGGHYAHRFPRILPDGDRFLFLAMSNQPEQNGIYLGSLARKTSKFLAASNAAPAYVAPDLLFVRDGRLLAQHLDLSTEELVREPVQVADQVLASPGGIMAASATDQVLAFLAGDAAGQRRLVWMGADGRPAATVGTPAIYDNPRLSPDGTRLAVFVPANDAGDIWIHDLERGTNTRFTFDAAVDNVPVWSPDGTRIAFSSNRDGGVFNLYVKSAGGTGADELLLKTPNNKLLNDWSADGRYLLYQEQDAERRSDLWAMPLFGDRKPIQVLATSFSERAGAFSPDGRWISYTSDESGTNQVYLQSFPPSGVKWQVSTERGAASRWRPDGKQLFYDRTGAMMAVDVLELSKDRFRAGAPARLFTGLLSIGPHNYDVAADGRRFLIVTNPQIALETPTPISVVLNWRSGLK